MSTSTFSYTLNYKRSPFAWKGLLSDHAPNSFLTRGEFVIYSYKEEENCEEEQ